MIQMGYIIYLLKLFANSLGFKLAARDIILQNYMTS